MKLVVRFLVLLVLLSAATLHADERSDRLKSIVDERAAAASAKSAAAVPSDSPKTDLFRSKASESPSDGISGIRVLQGLFLTLGVFFVGIWAYQKLNRQAMPKLSGRRIKLIERISVGHKTALVLAEIDGRSVLMSVGNERVAFFSDSSGLDGAMLEGAWEKEQKANQQS